MATRPVDALTVYFDAHCPFCQSCADWLGRRATHVPLRVVPSHLRQARERVNIPWLGHELIVVHDDGRFWAGPAAFLLCLWALRGGRILASILSSDILAPLTISFFSTLSAKRGRISRLLGHRCEGGCSPAGAYR